MKIRYKNINHGNNIRENRMSINERPTYELDKILDSISPEEFESYRSEHKVKSDKEVSIKEYYNDYIAAHKLELNDIVKKSDIPSNYAYGILNGNRKNPSRDRIIALCIACRMNLTETNRALKIAGHSPLYSKVSRDAAIIIMINKEEYSVQIVNEFLYGHSMDVLKTSNI